MKTITKNYTVGDTYITKLGIKLVFIGYTKEGYEQWEPKKG